MSTPPLDDVRRSPSDPGDWSPTDRELAVLRLICEGLANGDIAEQLVLSGRTVQTHVANLMRKSGARTRTELAVLAFREEIVPLWPEDGDERGDR